MQPAQAPVTYDETSRPPQSTGLEQTSEAPIRVLLIEDEPEAAELVRQYLEPEGLQSFTLAVKPTLQEGMDLASEREVDVILLDLGLPELSGHKSYRALAIATRDRVPIVVYTANDNIATWSLIVEFGAMDYLLKHTCTPSRLRRALMDAVFFFRNDKRRRRT